MYHKNIYSWVIFIFTPVVMYGGTCLTYTFSKGGWFNNGDTKIKFNRPLFHFKLKWMPSLQLCTWPLQMLLLLQKAVSFLMLHLKDAILSLPCPVLASLLLPLEIQLKMIKELNYQFFRLNISSSMQGKIFTDFEIAIIILT